MVVHVCNAWPSVAILGDKRAHNALEDAVALRAVVHHCADTLSLTTAALISHLCVALISIRRCWLVVSYENKSSH